MTKTQEDQPTSSAHIDFNARAELRKWPSLGGKRVSEAVHPYLVSDGSLEECIREVTAKPTASRHLYEIHTAPQSDVVSAVMSGEHVVELARLRDFSNRLYQRNE
jgi:hypothetical protein